jgi:hypothetical protein
MGETYRDQVLAVFLEATDELPDDAGIGIDALLAHPLLLQQAIREMRGLAPDVFKKPATRPSLPKPRIR